MIKQLPREARYKVAVVGAFSSLIALYASYLALFAGLVHANRGLDTIENVDKSAENRQMDNEQRNQIASQLANASKKAQCKVREQLDRVYQGQVYQYVPPCEAPIVNDAFETVER